MAGQPRIKTTVVGSYPVPDWLIALPSEQALIDATRVVLNTQEQAGIDLVCDGELSRFDVNHPETNGMIDYFVHPMSGIRARLSFDEFNAYRANNKIMLRTRPAAVVDGPVGSGTLDLPQAAAQSKQFATRPFKFTVTGPHMLAKTLLDHHYKNVPDLAMALADALADQIKHVDADVVQIDEANLPGNPDEWEWAAAALNRVATSVKGLAAVHLCFGNYGGQSTQKGAWDKLVNYLNALQVDHIVMETRHRPREELSVFKDVRDGIGLGIGVIDVKSTVIESADEVARTLEHAQKVLGSGRIKYIHPDCGFWMLKRYIADGKMRALVQGRNRYEGISSPPQ
ncbi:MAG: cobalamin-independent methionine synthase II family protein [Pseudorhodoplanes sp.]|uniref:cobalamin-independent methionine synthase II family protein n=1 Tax=Pseudorhodoplanes sp. TaxID=1934341 RepID=UPI003D150CFF